MIKTSSFFLIVLGFLLSGILFASSTKSTEEKNIDYSLSEKSTPTLEEKILFRYSPEEVFEEKKIFPLVQKIPQTKKCTIPAEIPTEIQPAFDEATQKIPCHLLQTLRKIEVFSDPEGKFPRALANGRILKIREDAITKPEFVQVLEHELGHVVDLGYLESTDFFVPSGYKDGSVTIYQDDASVDFYSLSWNFDGSKKSGITDLDFVGGYAAGDMFEDFAEAFLMYIEHGKEFRGLATENIILEQKYEFLKNKVFNRREFETGQNFYDSQNRPWDVTKL